MFVNLVYSFGVEVPFVYLYLKQFCFICLHHHVILQNECKNIVQKRCINTNVCSFGLQLSLLPFEYRPLYRVLSYYTGGLQVDHYTGVSPYSYTNSAVGS